MSVFKMFTKVALIFFVQLAICIYSVNSLCSFPCVKRGQTYINDRDGIQFHFPSTEANSTRLVNTGPGFKDVLECYDKVGPFYAVRKLDKKGDQFQCFKDTAMDIEGGLPIATVYGNNWRRFPFRPTLCEICAGILPLPSIYRAASVDAKIANSIKPLPLGCNLPRNCPGHSYTDVPCIGCEREYDNGLCCQHQQIANKVVH